jgi:tripartite ATP-independent transporter DctM subunit
MYTLSWLILFILLLFIGTPIAASIGLASMLVITLFNLAPLSFYGGVFLDVFNSFILTAIPMFILTGLVMSEGVISEKIWHFCNTILGHITGGLGYVNITASMIFGGISGSSTADAGGLGLVEIDGMVKHGYPKTYASSITLASSVMAQNIPPSIIAVVFGFVARTNIVAQLFAGIGPGILIAIALGVVNHFSCKHMKKKGTLTIDCDNFNFKNILSAFSESIWALLAPVILLGGILSGKFTPTEAGAVAALYTIIVSMFVYNSLSIKQLPRLFVRTGSITGAAMLVVGSASLLKLIFVKDGLQITVANFLMILPSNTYILLAMLLVIIVLGCVMECLPALLLTVPIFLPVAHMVGIHPVHLGAMMIAGFSVGMLTPPVGISLLIVSNISNIPIPRLAKATVPFYISLIIAVIIIAMVPEISLWIPRALGLL